MPRTSEGPTMGEVSCRSSALLDEQRDAERATSVPEPYRADREIVLVAVQEDGQALQHAAEEYRPDHQIVLAAVEQNGGRWNTQQRSARQTARSCWQH
eukprot:6270100-Amphidinium_carterae.1